MEIWDGYYEDGTLAGVDLIRGEKIPVGLRHAVVEVFVMHTDGTILLVQRDFNKPNFPGLFESGAGGSVLKGEILHEGAIRELKEETGIISSELKSIYKVVTHNTIYKGYLCVKDMDKSKITLQIGETIDYRWVTKMDFLAFYNTNQFVPTLRERLRNFIDNDFSIIQ